MLCALAATLAGCSNQSLTQRSCTGLNPLACLTAVDIPIEAASQNGSADANVAAVASHEQTPPRAQADRSPRRVPGPAKVATKAAPAVPLPVPSPRTSEPTIGMAPASDADRTGALQAPAASAVAEGMSSPTPEMSLDTLVAILVTGPDVRSVNELAGKTVAIDDRYSEPSVGRVRIALAAAGASEVRLSKGQTTAIARLAGREVPAAVIGLVSVSAADSFPELAGFKTVRVPLAHRVAKR